MQLLFFKGGTTCKLKAAKRKGIVDYNNSVKAFKVCGKVDCLVYDLLLCPGIVPTPTRITVTSAGAGAGCRHERSLQ